MIDRYIPDADFIIKVNNDISIYGQKSVICCGNCWALNYDGFCEYQNQKEHWSGLCNKWGIKK